MTFAIFVPESANSKPANVLYWLSGLTCTDENFCQKGAAFNRAAKLGLCIVCPDTSPRGLDLPGEHDHYDFGSGAGFYLDATQEPWSKHYNMNRYVVDELPSLVETNFPVSDKKSISGHSMGGHGALSIGIKNAAHYASISAFSPIVNPLNCPWGRKAFTHYLGSDKAHWAEYDSCELLKKYGPVAQTLLIDQGLADEFLDEQLLTNNFESVSQDVEQKLILNKRVGYDHSFYFISTFINSHLDFHARALKA